MLHKTRRWQSGRRGDALQIRLCKDHGKHVAMPGAPKKTPCFQAGIRVKPRWLPVRKVCIVLVGSLDLAGMPVA